MEKMNLNNKNESVTRKIVKELLNELRTARSAYSGSNYGGINT